MTTSVAPSVAIGGQGPAVAWQVFDVGRVLADIQDLYLDSATPWIIGYSGGKDSTTVLQMVFYALAALPPERLIKDVHVICNDTLVENPAIRGYVERQLGLIECAGKGMLFKHNPTLFHVDRVHPVLEDRFWFNLIGNGYPSPNRWFRWCTERLKIEPTSQYCRATIKNCGRIVIVLGTRKAESANRALSMRKHDTGQRLRSHSLPGAFVYAPIQDLSNNEVWAYLLQAPSPWGGDNREILRMYESACTGGECPFVVETGTQSCGKSRFGCWVCTVVDRDRSMESLVENGEAWMEDLLLLRNWLYNIRQQTNQYVPKHLESKAKFGPFLLRTRLQILERLLRVQDGLSLELISAQELGAIRNMLAIESKFRTDGEMTKFVLEVASGGRVDVVSDSNLLQTPRKRLGPFDLKKARLVETARVSSEYSRSTRVMYYRVSQ